MKNIRLYILGFLFVICACLYFENKIEASTTYSRYFSALADYNAGNPIDDRDLDGEFDAMTIALNRKVLCAGSAPTSPIAGQTWVDTTNKLLKVYRNNEWVIIGGIHVSSSEMTTAQEGDAWFNTTTNEIQFYDGTDWDGLKTTNMTASGNLSVNGNVYIGNNLNIDGSLSVSGASFPLMKIGSYTGDGNATQAVTGVGFQALMLIVAPSTGSPQMTQYLKLNTDLTESCSPFGSTARYADIILSIESDGFTVGDGTGGGENLNQDGYTYVYIAMRY